MKAFKELGLLAGLTALNTPFIGSDMPQKVGFKKSMLPSKDYAKRKRRLKITGKSRNINHRIK